MERNERPTVESTIELIKELHGGTFDDTGLPFWMHPVEVMRMLPAEADDEERMAALLHDSTEDGAITEDGLRAMGYSERVLWLVGMLDRKNAPAGMTYMDWIRYLGATNDPSLIRIKLKDNCHNSDIDRIAAITDPEKRRRAEDRAGNRYARSIKILGKALAELETGRMPSP